VGTILLLIGGALFVALITFILVEEKSLKDANFSDMKGLFTEERTVNQCMTEFNTVGYMVKYFALILIINAVISITQFMPNDFGLKEILAYTFIPAFVGSAIILLVKWTYQPVIKVISAMMYGFSYIVATSLAFAFTYLLFAN